MPYDKSPNLPILRLFIAQQEMYNIILETNIGCKIVLINQWSKIISINIDMKTAYLIFESKCGLKAKSIPIIK